MSEESSAIPLADILRAANELVAAGLIENYALGGALAAIYYVEPFTTYDVDIIFVAAEKGLTAGIPAIYAHLQAHGWRVEREHLLVKNFPVRFLAAAGLTEEAVRQARGDRIRRSAREGLPSRVYHRDCCQRGTTQGSSANRTITRTNRDRQNALGRHPAQV